VHSQAACRPDYRIIFMRRPMPEVVASWKRFYHRRKGINQDGKPLLYFEEPIRRSAKEIAKEFGVKPAQVLRVKYHDVIRDPKLAAAAMVEFLGVPLDVDAMAGAVDPSLYRNRLARKKWKRLHKWFWVGHGFSRAVKGQ